jgi:hypothetical protein
MKSVEVCFKSELLARKEYKRHAEVLGEVLKDGVAYSLREVDNFLINHCKGRVGKCEG